MQYTARRAARPRHKNAMRRTPPPSSSSSYFRFGSLLLTYCVMVTMLVPGSAFSVIPSLQSWSVATTRTTRTCSSSNNRSILRVLGHLSLQNDDENGETNNHDPDQHDDTDDDPDENEVITHDMFLRDMLSPAKDVVVRKKQAGKNNKGGNNSNQKKKEYKVLDNRDILPFAVQLQTPDPYTHPEIKQKRALKPKKKRRANAVEEQIASRLYNTNGKDNTKTLLGEFNLDKHTTTGDVLVVGDDGHEYKVVRHKCQYRYAGGQRFVMVRKILEVKEVGRLRTEQALKKQFSQTFASDNDDDYDQASSAHDEQES